MWFAAAIKDETIVATTFTKSEQDALKQILEDLPYNVPFRVSEKQNPFSEQVLSVLKSIYDGKDVNPQFRLEMKHLSSYAQKVLRCVSQIPVGYVTTYGEIAKTMGGSPRAVGRVMATNPFPPLIPCHRVVRSDFTPGGFGLGTNLKWEILQRENRGYTREKKIKADGKTLFLFPVNFLRKRGKQHRL
jgi:methylated-DNA-[protein]-cysteine S-methyltransferase